MKDETVVSSTESVGGCWIPPWILHDEDLTSPQKILAGRILSLSIREGYCFASDEYLGEDLGQSPRTVRRHVRTLVEAGHFSKQLTPKPDGGTVRRLYPENRAARFVRSGGPSGQKRPTERPNPASRAAKSVRVVVDSSDRQETTGRTPAREEDQEGPSGDDDPRLCLTDGCDMAARPSRDLCTDCLKARRAAEAT